ncbi:class I SAM-dependent methyltransferase [bacterium]|nr:class I SAM-dependent methyltransferase [bacterium]
MQTRAIALCAVAALAFTACRGAPASAPAAAEPQTKTPSKAVPSGGKTDGNIIAAVANPARPDSDRQRDAARKPHEVMRLARVRQGDKVVDFGAGRGYYTRLLSGAVGEAGQVTAFNPTWLMERFPQLNDAMAALASNPAFANVRAAQAPMDAPGFEAGSLDSVFIVLLYHDAFWNGVDVAKMNRAIFDGLRSGGRYVVIDHQAEAGSGTRDVENLHRIDSDLVRQQVMAAGFELESTGEFLGNPDDPRTDGVFGDLRGNTDRFVYVFTKP